jgi:hypothetical protein
MIVAFVGFSRIFLLGILIFKGRLYKSFGVKGLRDKQELPEDGNKLPKHVGARG